MGAQTVTLYSHGETRPLRPRDAGDPGGVRAQYDNARTTPENQRQWQGVDYLSAKAANSFQVRRQLRMRSRYEVGSNPILFGVVNSNADDLIDAGPTLQVRTADPAYNRLVERLWAEWCDEVGLVEKLRTAKLAKSVDGEGFLVLKTVGELESPAKVFPLDLEADQVTTPAPKAVTDFWVDGVTLHPVTGRPTHYHVLKHHPGDLFVPDFNPLAVDAIPARHVIHWFNKFRPGMVRGLPAFSTSLDLFTELRSFRRAVLGGAEIAADFAAVLTSTAPAFAEDDDAEYEPFKRVPINRKMMTLLPAGMEMKQFDPKQPATSYEMFQEKCLAEACRPLSYPLNLALGTSQKFNFSSAKLDHVNYRNGLTVERAGCNAAVLDRLFAAFFEELALGGVVGMVDGLNPPAHEWHWPGFEPLDAAVDAQADADRLAGGMLTWREFWARRGRDWRDVMRQQAEERDEVERLGLTFGEPVQRSVSQADADEDAGTDSGADAGGKPKGKPAAKPAAGKPGAGEKGGGKPDADDAAADGSIQAAALNGAQISSLVALADKVVQKVYPADAAEALVQASFPLMPQDLIKRFIRGLVNAPTPPEPAATPAAAAAARRLLRAAGVRALATNPDQARDADGKFAGGGGGPGVSLSDKPGVIKAAVKAAAAKVKAGGHAAVKAAKAVAAKANEIAYRATWAAYAAKVYADDIADTSHDYSQIIKAKDTGDWLSTHTGLSAGTAAVVGSHVLGYAHLKLKQAIAKRHAKEGAAAPAKAAHGPGLRAAAEMSQADRAAAAVGVMAELLGAMGCPESEIPTARQVAAWMAWRDACSEAATPARGPEVGEAALAN
jgi:capsid protein